MSRISKLSLATWIAVALLSSSAGTRAEEPASPAETAANAEAAQTAARGRVEAILSGLQFRNESYQLKGAKAALKPSNGFRVLDARDAQRVLEQVWGNPPDESVLGMLVPGNVKLTDDHAWAVVVTYSDDGYVTDDDAAKTDYDKMLKEMQESTRDSNDERKQAGYGAIELVGWAAKPHYDSSGKKLYWAKELSFDGAPEHTLNYDIRMLGRRGYLSLNAVASMSDLSTVEAGMQDVLAMAEFDSGERYADYSSSTDKLAGYGLAALVGGAVAAKAGLFAKLFAVLLAAKKLVVVAFVAIVAGIKKFFGRNTA